METSVTQLSMFGQKEIKIVFGKPKDRRVKKRKMTNVVGTPLPYKSSTRDKDLASDTEPPTVAVKALTQQMVKPMAKPRKRTPRAQDTPAMQKIKKVYTVLVAKEFALVLFLLLQVGQTFHTTYALHYLTGMSNWASWVYSIVTALGLDLIVVHLVGRGRTNTARVFMVFYFCVNLFAYITNPIVNQSWWLMAFALIPAFYIPYAAHELSTEMTKNN